MIDPLKIAIVGMDSSHTQIFAKYLQSPERLNIDGLNNVQVTKCMRFPSSFQSEEGQDLRQADLENSGISVTRNFDEAVDGCDAIMLEVNDPALHLEYLTMCLDLGKPIFLDKPLADKKINGCHSQHGKGTQYQYHDMFTSAFCKRICGCLPSVIRSRENNHLYSSRDATGRKRCYLVWSPRFRDASARHGTRRKVSTCKRR